MQPNTILQVPRGYLKTPNRILEINEVIKSMHELRTLRHRKVHEEPVLARRRVLDECFGVAENNEPTADQLMSLEGYIAELWNWKDAHLSRIGQRAKAIFLSPPYVGDGLEEMTALVSKICHSRLRHTPLRKSRNFEEN